MTRRVFDQFGLYELSKQQAVLAAFFGRRRRSLFRATTWFRRRGAETKFNEYLRDRELVEWL